MKSKQKDLLHKLPIQNSCLPFYSRSAGRHRSANNNSPAATNWTALRFSLKRENRTRECDDEKWTRTRLRGAYNELEKTGEHSSSSGAMEEPSNSFAGREGADGFGRENFRGATASKNVVW
jgi:hypothetical protein